MAILSFNRKIYVVQDIYLSLLLACRLYYATKYLLFGKQNKEQKKGRRLKK